jgi:transcriptional regulator with XRE-family HTH domain
MAYPSFQLAFGTRVRELRAARGYSQEAFATHANIDRGFFGRLERGEINAGLASMSRIAVGLGVSLSELLSGVVLDEGEVRALPRSARGPKRIGT